MIDSMILCIFPCRGHCRAQWQRQCTRQWPRHFMTLSLPRALTVSLRAAMTPSMPRSLPRAMPPSVAVASHVTQLLQRRCYLQLETSNLSRPLSAVHLIEPVVRQFRRKWFRVRLFQFFLGNYFISLLAKTIFCVPKAFDQNVIFKTQYI